jgi:cardiolipin synthase
MAAGKWNIANIISLYRIVAIPVLFTMIVLHERSIFTALLVVSLLSDIADGIIARTFKLQTELGARLDSIGDMGTFFTCILALFVFELPFLKENYIPIGGVIFLYVLEVAIALIKFRKISSFHTLLCKIAAYAQGIFLVSLFLAGFIPWIFYPAIAITAIAYLEEIAIVMILPENISNVKGIRYALRVKQEK